MENKNSLLTDNINKIFYRYLFNSILGVLSTSICILVDTMFIGRGIGSNGLSALNIAIPVFNVFNGIGLLFGMGGATALSISRGKGNEIEALKIFTQTIFIALISGLCISAIGVINTEKIAYLLGANNNNLILVKEYLNGVLFFSFSYIMVHAMAAFIRNDQNPKLVMIATSTGGILNIILDYLFIFEFGMGMKGAALATSIASLTNLLILLTHFISKKYGLNFKYFKLNMNSLLRTLGNGAPSFIIEISSGIVIFIFNLSILEMVGEMGVSAYSIIANVSLVIVAIFTGISQAMQPIVSLNYGANNKSRVYLVKTKSIRIAFFIGVIFYIIGLMYPKFLVGIFTTEKGEIVDITVNAIRYYFIAFLIMGYNIVMGAYYQSIEKKIVSNIISLSRGIIFLIIGISTLPWILGVNGIWTTAVFSEVATFLGIVIYIFIEKEKASN